LPIPDSRYTEGSAQNTSVELFLQRARRAHVSFQAKPEDYPVIVRICQLVNGMPLGIELAAAWTRTLTCHEIVQEIERGLDFLSVSTRDLPARHRSMRAVFVYSLDTGQARQAFIDPRLFEWIIARVDEMKIFVGQRSQKRDASRQPGVGIHIDHVAYITIRINRPFVSRIKIPGYIGRSSTVLNVQDQDRKIPCRWTAKVIGLRRCRL
jgi:hypothetical protein